MSIEMSVEYTDIWSNEALVQVSEQDVMEAYDSTIDSVGIYLNQIGKIALLQAGQEAELAKDIEAGLYAQHLLERESFASTQEFHDLEEMRRQGERARTQLVEANLRLVIPIAKRYRGKGVPFLDLIQEGGVGLMMAAQNYDYAKGFKFSTFATHKISERIIRSFFTQGYNDPVDRKTGENLSKLSNLTRRLKEELGRAPTKEELGVKMKMTEQEITALQQLGSDKLSLDMPVGEDDAPLGGAMEDADGQNPLDTLIAMSMRDEVGEVLSRLDDSKKTIIRSRFGFDEDRIVPHMTLAKKLKMPYKRVKELEEEILDDLRNDDRVEDLRDYLY